VSGRADVQPVLVRVPVELAARLAEEAARQDRSRHALILDKLNHECSPDPRPAPPRDWATTQERSKDNG
jgi:hypothetical protein